MREIKADGHCLYRAVAEQLSLTGRRPGLTEESYLIMRGEAARWVRQRKDQASTQLRGVLQAPWLNVSAMRSELLTNERDWGGSRVTVLCGAGLGHREQARFCCEFSAFDFFVRRNRRGTKGTRLEGKQMFCRLCAYY